MEHCPIQDVFEGVVRAVVARPSRDAFEEPPVVEVASMKLGNGSALHFDETPLKQRPSRGRDRCGGVEDKRWRIATRP
jgi:hypothetical protein